jgi:hypothetical protein
MADDSAGCLDTGSLFGKCGRGTCNTIAAVATSGAMAARYECLCEAGWAKSSTKWHEAEQLCIIPEPFALVVFIVLFVLSVVALLSVSLSSWYSLRKLFKSTDDKVKIKRALARRFYFTGALMSIVGTSLSGIIPSFHSESLFFMDETATRWMASTAVLCVYFLLVLSALQLEKYYRFTFTNKSPRFLFPLLYALLTASYFIVVPVLQLSFFRFTLVDVLHIL